MFVLCTINGPCAWHQAIAGTFNNKKLNAKLICDFGITRYIFYAVFAGLRVKGFKDLTDLLSGEKRVTCSAIKPLIEVIHDKMVIPKDDEPLK